MKVSVFGATGKTGQYVWRQAVARGHINRADVADLLVKQVDVREYLERAVSVAS